MHPVARRWAGAELDDVDEGGDVVVGHHLALLHLSDEVGIDLRRPLAQLLGVDLRDHAD